MLRPIIVLMTTMLSLSMAQNTPPSQGTPPGGGSGTNGSAPRTPSNPNNPTLPGENNPNPNNPSAPAAPNDASVGNNRGVNATPENPVALFLGAIQQSNRFEIESSQEALKEQVSAATRDFATMMIAEHTKAQTQVIQLAQRKNFATLMPKDSGPVNRALIGTAAALSGPAFQKEYLSAQYQGHANTIKILRGYIQNGKDAEARALAQKLLPAVQSHFYMVGRLIATGGASNGAKAKSMNMPASSTPKGGNNPGGTGSTGGNAGNGASSNGAGGNGSSGNGGNNNGAGAGTPPKN